MASFSYEDVKSICAKVAQTDIEGIFCIPQLKDKVEGLTTSSAYYFINKMLGDNYIQEADIPHNAREKFNLKSRNPKFYKLTAPKKVIKLKKANKPENKKSLPEPKTGKKTTRKHTSIYKYLAKLVMKFDGKFMTKDLIASAELGLIKPNTIKTYIKELVDDGVINKVGNVGKSNIYEAANVVKLRKSKSPEQTPPPDETKTESSDDDFSDNISSDDNRILVSKDELADALMHQFKKMDIQHQKDNQKIKELEEEIDSLSSKLANNTDVPSEDVKLLKKEISRKTEIIYKIQEERDEMKLKIQELMQYKSQVSDVKNLSNIIPKMQTEHNEEKNKLSRIIKNKDIEIGRLGNLVQDLEKKLTDYKTEKQKFLMCIKEKDKEIKNLEHNSKTKQKNKPKYAPLHHLKDMINNKS